MRKDCDLPKSIMLALAGEKTPRRCKTVWQMSIVAGVAFAGG